MEPSRASRRDARKGPLGTASGVPTGRTTTGNDRNPSSELLGYYQASLRDEKVVHSTYAFAANASAQASSASRPLRWQKSPSVSRPCCSCLKQASTGTSVGTISSKGTSSL